MCPCSHTLPHCMAAAPTKVHPQGSLQNARDFMYRKNIFDWMHGNEYNQLCHKVWRTLREGRFVVPQTICSHMFPPNCGLDNSRTAHPLHATSGGSTTWQVYDFNQAGCLLCGAMHLCFDGSCPVEQNAEGYKICTVTGMCVKKISFSDEEFLDTVCMSEAMVPVVKPSTPKRKGLMSSADPEEGPQTIGSAKRAKCPEATLKVHVPRNAHQPANCSSSRCSVNKKNRYRSWVYNKVMTPATGKGSDRTGDNHVVVSLSAAASKGEPDADRIR